MSRRRPEPRASHSRAGRFRFEVYCTGRGHHGEERIAKVTVDERLDLDRKFYVRVEYLPRYREADEVRQTFEPRTSEDGYWMVRTFPCFACGRRDVPLRDDTLAELALALATADKRRVDLSDLAGLL